MQIQQQNQQSHQKNEVLSEQYFQLCKKRKEELQNKFQGIRINVIPSELSERLIGNIEQKMDNLGNALNKCYIYIVIMGTQSTGKSTFLNALLGHELLSSKTQNCISKVTYIGHQNVNANQNTNITINEKNFDSVKKAAQYLTAMQDDPNLKQVKIRTQSYFHRNLSQEYQDRIIFVDTPGIQLVNCTPDEYKLQIDKINEQIQLDEHSIRINVWVSDYTTLDRDVFQKDIIISNLIGSIEYYQYQMQNHDDNQIQQSTDLNKLFFIINKFNQRQRTQDNAIEQILVDIKGVFNSRKLFKISASQALNYNILNYGTEEDAKNFIDEYFENNQVSQNFQDIDDAEDYCKRRIKNNLKFIESQDFYELISEISKRIKLEVKEMLNLKFNSLNLMISYLYLIKILQEDKNTLTKTQKANISNLLNSFFQKNKNYNQQLQCLQIEFVKLIYNTMNQTLTKIKKQDPQAVKYFNQQTNIQLNQLIQRYREETEDFNNQFLMQLLKEFSSRSQIQDFKSILDILMEDSKFKEQTQLILTQALKLYSEFGNNVIISAIDINGAIGAYDENGIAAFIGFAALGAYYTAYCTATTTLITGGVSIVCGAVGYVGYMFVKKIYKSYQLKQKLKQWNEKLVKFSEQLAVLYINMYEQNLKQINHLIESMIQ